MAAATSDAPATPDTPTRLPARSARRTNILAGAALALLAGVLWGTRPAPSGRRAPANVEQTRGCLSNLNRIAAAIAQYAQDYDGKFPRGVDAEDRDQPQSWPVLRADGKRGDARDLPMLHDLLFPYLRDRTLWHCPGDTGWDELRRPTQSTLRNVKPSSYARFGTSYYYLTRHGFAGWRAVDIERPDLDVVLFDGDAWHHTDDSPSFNVLFADGHVQNMMPRPFDELYHRSVG